MTERKLIYADTVVEKLSELIQLDDHEKKVLESFVETCLAVDAVPVVHGRWVMGFSVRCSVCNGYALTDEDHDPWITPYCPNCGSKMDGGSHEVD